MTTFWLSFHDHDKTRREQFLGVAIFDMDETEGEKSASEIAGEAWRLGINPGRECQDPRRLFRETDQAGA
jgi:hypothetical protein